MTANGQPDQSRSSRYILKEYVCGKLLYCHAPTGVIQEEFHTFPDRVRPEIIELNLPQQQQRALRVSRARSRVVLKKENKKHTLGINYQTDRIASYNFDPFSDHVQ